MDLFWVHVARLECCCSSDRPARTETIFKSCDSNPKKIQVGRLEPKEDSSRVTRTQQRFKSGDSNHFARSRRPGSTCVGPSSRPGGLLELLYLFIVCSYFVGVKWKTLWNQAMTHSAAQWSLLTGNGGRSPGTLLPCALTWQRTRNYAGARHTLPS